MKSLFPEDWDNLITKMKNNDTLLQTFNRSFLLSVNLPSAVKS